MTSRNAAIELRSVTHAYEKHAVLQAINILAEPGEYVTIVGPSGSGKTTLLRIVAGLERQQRGHVYFNGIDMTRRSPRARDVAMVFQEASLYDHMSARRNMRFGARRRGLSAEAADRRIDHISRQLGITDILDRKPWQLSGGEVQRVAIGRAMVRESSCLLLDEPFSDLDTPLRRQLAGDMKAIHTDRPRTTLHVTHDQREAMILGNSVVVMYAGHVQQVAGPRELYSQPANRFVAGFIGDDPMNFFDGILEASGETIRFRSAALDVDLSVSSEPADRGSKDVTLGIRAGRIQMRASSAAETLPMNVKSVSVIGSIAEIDGLLEDGTKVLVTTTAEAAPSIGQVVHASFDARDVYIFERGPLGRAIG